MTKPSESTNIGEPISIVIVAMGGQGGGVLSNWIVALAESAGYLAQSTSVPGVAQRTGSTVYYVELFERNAADAAGRMPVLSLMPTPGDVDITIGGELAELGRAILRGFTSKDRTVLIGSTHRDYALEEKMIPGDGRINGSKILESCRENSKLFYGFDMVAAANDAESIISSVMFGALAQSGALPFPRKQFEEVIERSGIAIEKNLRGFREGYDRGAQTAANSLPDSTDIPRQRRESPPPKVQSVLDRVESEFPQETHEIVAEAVHLLTDYQDAAHAIEYLDLLKEVLDADNRESTDTEFELTKETARYLALWMTYEDSIRVAELKTRADRFARVRKEVRATPGQIVNVREFMHPRLEEICDILPRRLGGYLLKSPGWSRLLRRFLGKGRQVQTSSLSGFLLLYLISSLKRFRRSSYRYSIEGSRIAQWRSTILENAATNYDLAVEIAECQRLIKGYGDTHEKGLQSFNRIIDEVARIRHQPNASADIRMMRESALNALSGDSPKSSKQP